SFDFASGRLTMGGYGCAGLLSAAADALDGDVTLQEVSDLALLFDHCDTAESALFLSTRWPPRTRIPIVQAVEAALPPGPLDAAWKGEANGRQESSLRGHQQVCKLLAVRAQWVR